MGRDVSFTIVWLEDNPSTKAQTSWELIVQFQTLNTGECGWLPPVAKSHKSRCATCNVIIYKLLKIQWKCNFRHDDSEKIGMMMKMGGVRVCNLRRNELDFFSLVQFSWWLRLRVEISYENFISSHTGSWIQSEEVHEPSNRVQQSVIRSSSQLSTNQFSSSRIAFIVSCHPRSNLSRKHNHHRENWAKKNVKNVYNFFSCCSAAAAWLTSTMISPRSFIILRLNYMLIMSRWII